MTIFTRVQSCVVSRVGSKKFSFRIFLEHLIFWNFKNREEKNEISLFPIINKFRIFVNIFCPPSLLCGRVSGEIKIVSFSLVIPEEDFSVPFPPEI